MSRPIELSHKQWMYLREQLHKDYPRSVMLLRGRMQAKLGFVEKKRTFFMIKYSEYIQTEYVNDDF